MKNVSFLTTLFAAIALSTITVSACPKWECQYPIDYYGCGCTRTCYDENSIAQPQYCSVCGEEAWNCSCDYDYDYDYDYGYGESYDGSYCSGNEYSSTEMSHWANIRDSYGNIIGQVNSGDSIEIIGADCNDSERVIIYDYATGCQGSVLRSCVYGGYSWDGTGDNGIYNSYQGESCDNWDNVGYTNCNTGCSNMTYVAYSEIIRNYMAITTGGYCFNPCGF